MRIRRSSERGAELVEFALVFPLLLAIFAGIVDFGLMFQRFLVMTNAAREGARIAVLPGYSTTDVENRVSAYVTAGFGGGTPTVTVATVSIDPPGATPPFNAAQVTVRMTHSYLILGPVLQLLGGSALSSAMTASSTMRFEIG